MCFSEYVEGRFYNTAGNLPLNVRQLSLQGQKIYEFLIISQKQISLEGYSGHLCSSDVSKERFRPTVQFCLLQFLKSFQVYPFFSFLALNCSPGHIKGGFDNPAENLFQTGPSQKAFLKP